MSQSTINRSSSDNPRYLDGDLDDNKYTTVITSDILRIVASRIVELDFLSSRTGRGVLHRVSNEPRAVLFAAVALTFINFERTRCHIST